MAVRNFADVIPINNKLFLLYTLTAMCYSSAKKLDNCVEPCSWTRCAPASTQPEEFLQSPENAYNEDRTYTKFRNSEAL